MAVGSLSVRMYRMRGCNKLQPGLILPSQITVNISQNTVDFLTATGLVLRVQAKAVQRPQDTWQQRAIRNKNIVLRKSV